MMPSMPPSGLAHGAPGLLATAAVAHLEQELDHQLFEEGRFALLDGFDQLGGQRFMRGLERAGHALLGRLQHLVVVECLLGQSRHVALDLAALPKPVAPVDLGQKGRPIEGLRHHGAPFVREGPDATRLGHVPALDQTHRRERKDGPPADVAAALVHRARPIVQRHMGFDGLQSGDTSATVGK